MALLPYLFLVLIVLMSGGIAVLADDVGRRLGKKRLHVRGLRPKRVAQLGTFFVGIFVSFVTIAIVAALSSDVRQWIVAGNQAIQRAKEAEAEYRTTESALLAAQRKNGELEHANQTLQGESKQARTQLATDKRDEAALSRRLGDLRLRVAQLRERFAGANRTISQLNAEVDLRKQALASVQIRLHSTDESLRSVNERLALATKSFVAANGQLKEAVAQKRQTDDDNQRLMQEKARLLAEKTRLTAEKASLEQQSAEAGEHYATVTRNLDQANRDLDEAKRQLQNTQQELDTAEGLGAFWRTVSQPPRTALPTYLRGSEVARLAVPSGMSYQRAEQEVTTLLRMARLDAKGKGAAAHGPYLEATIVPHQDPDTKIVRTPDQLERDVVNRIAGAREPMILVASSSINAFQGEPVSIEIRAIPNPIVFRNSTLVAKTEVDGRLETDQIYHQLALLGQKVQERAAEVKMIPRLGDDELYGTISPDEVLHLVNQVKAMNRNVEVRAFADGDTRAGDRLKLRFSVR